jgi:hypothetical protein
MTESFKRQSQPIQCNQESVPIICITACKKSRQQPVPKIKSSVRSTMASQMAINVLAWHETGKPGPAAFSPIVSKDPIFLFKPTEPSGNESVRIRLRWKNQHEGAKRCPKVAATWHHGLGHRQTMDGTTWILGTWQRGQTGSVYRPGKPFHQQWREEG